MLVALGLPHRHQSYVSDPGFQLWPWIHLYGPSFDCQRPQDLRMEAPRTVHICLHEKLLFEGLAWSQPESLAD